MLVVREDTVAISCLQSGGNGRREAGQSLAP